MGDLLELKLHPLRGLIPEDGLHFDEVDYASKVFLSTNWDDNRYWISTQTRPHLIHNFKKVGAGPIHLVDKGKPGDFVFVSLAPNSLRLWLNTANRTVDHTGAVKYTHRAFYLDRKINVSRGINNIESVLGVGHVHPLPKAGGGRRGDRNSTLLLLLHPVHRGCAIVDFADLVINACVEKNSLRSRRFTCINVRTDANIPITLNRGLASHKKSCC